MPYRISYTNRFKKDVKRCFKRGLKMEKLQAVIDILSSEGSLPASYKPHPLSGNHANQWECHLTPDWLMIWEQNDKELSLLFLQTGSHSDLF